MNRDELLDAVVESPNDDGPRLVYADWLLQQTDAIDRARGEYISLACSSAHDPDRAKKRMKELLAKHETDWLGAVATVTDPDYRHWARGFLEACTLEVFGLHPAERAIGHSAWRTLRTLTMTGTHYSEGEVRALITQPAIANLRGLYAYQSVVEGMAEWPTAPRVFELAVAPAGEPTSRLVPLFTADCFARVRRLHVFCDPELGCAFMRPELTLIVIAGPNTLANWLATLNARAATFEEVRLVSSVFHHLARRGIELVVRCVAGRWSALEVRWSALEVRWSALEVRWGDASEAKLRDATISSLGRLPEGVLTHLSFVGPATKRFDVSRFKQRVTAALVPRQPGLLIASPRP